MVAAKYLSHTSYDNLFMIQIDNLLSVSLSMLLSIIITFKRLQQVKRIEPEFVYWGFFVKYFLVLFLTRKVRHIPAVATINYHFYEGQNYGDRQVH